MKNNIMANINGEKLKKALEARGLNYCDVSTKLGYSRSYLSNVFSSGRIRLSIIEDIWNEYGIAYDEYMSDEEDGSELITDELYNTVYRAICDALKDNQVLLFNTIAGSIKKGMIDFEVNQANYYARKNHNRFSE